MVINTPRLQLRPWRMGDLNLLVEYANNPHVTAFLRDAFPHPYTRGDGIAFIELAAREQPPQIFAIEYLGIACGSVGVFPLDDVYQGTAEIGYWLGEPFWGKGLTTEAVQAVVAYGFQTWDLRRIFARVFSENKASHRLLEKAGFTLECVHRQALIKTGKVMDEWVYVRFS